MQAILSNKRSIRGLFCSEVRSRAHFHLGFPIWCLEGSKSRAFDVRLPNPTLRKVFRMRTFVSRLVANEYPCSRGGETAYGSARGALLFSILLTGITVAAFAVAADVPVRLSDLNATLNEIAPHARSYAPKFSSPEERVQTEEHLKALLAQLDKISDRYPDDEDILFIKGAANAMGHNLDYPGCADKAMAAFDRLFAIDPNNRRALYEYGGFLSGTTLLDKAIPYLEWSRCWRHRPGLPTLPSGLAETGRDFRCSHCAIRLCQARPRTELRQDIHRWRVSRGRSCFGTRAKA